MVKGDKRYPQGFETPRGRHFSYYKINDLTFLNAQAQEITGIVHFSAPVSDQYSPLAPLPNELDPSTYVNQQKDAQELDTGKMHLDAIRKLRSG